MKRTSRLGTLAIVGSILASIAPGCGGGKSRPDAADMTSGGAGGTSAIPDHLTNGAAADTGTDPGTDTHMDAGTEMTPDAAPTSDGGTGYTGSCQANPDPSPVLLPNAQLDATVIARAAAVLAVCSLSDDGTPRVAAQLWNGHNASRSFWHLSVTQARCVSEARCGCEAAEHCLGYTLERGVPPGCQSSCNGDVFRGCGQAVDLIDGYAFDVDCSKIGQHCHPTGICVDDVSATCDDAQSPICGVGGRPLYCTDGVLNDGPDCAGLGLVCSNGECLGTGAGCTSHLSFRETVIEFENTTCQDSGTLQACVGGKQASQVCAEQGPGFSCQSVSGVAFCGLASDCIPANVDGDPSDPAATCDGTRLTFCNAGRLDTVDCADLGFTGCGLDASEHYGCTPGLAP